MPYVGCAPPGRAGGAGQGGAGRRRQPRGGGRAAEEARHGPGGAHGDAQVPAPFWQGGFVAGGRGRLLTVYS